MLSYANLESACLIVPFPDAIYRFFVFLMSICLRASYEC
jgi:hypothetical protein